MRDPAHSRFSQVDASPLLRTFGRAARPLTIAAGLIVIWQMVVWLTGVPRFILPG